MKTIEYILAFELKGRTPAHKYRLYKYSKTLGSAARRFVSHQLNLEN